MKIQARMSLGIGVLALAIVVSSVLSVFSSMRILSQEEQIYSVRLVSSNRLLESDRDAFQTNAAVLNLILSNWESRADSILNDVLVGVIEENKTLTRSRFSQYAQLMTDQGSEITQGIEDFEGQYAVWSQVTDSLVSDVEVGNLPRAKVTYEREYNSAFANMRGTIDRLITLSLAGAAEEHQEVQTIGQGIITTNIIVGIINLVLVAGVLMVVVRAVFIPLRKMGAQVALLSQGSGDLTLRLATPGKTELDHLGSNVNQFIEKTETILLNLRDQVGSADQVKAALVEDIDKNQRALTQLLEAISEIRISLNHQDQEVRAISESASQANGSVQGFESQVHEQVAMVEESTAAVTEMIASIQNLAAIAQSRKDATAKLRSAVEEGDQQVKETNEKVQSINGAIGSIEEMTRVIAGIASQTNLLAMNAAIEAAHAGDFGRGFAVVADEIRKLAETAATQSSSIRKVLKEIIGSIKSASSSSSFTSELYDTIHREFEALSGAFDEIASNAGELNNGGAQILEAMETLQNQSGGVRGDVSSLKESTETIDRALDSLTKSSSSITSATETMEGQLNTNAQALSHMKKSADQLEHAMDLAQKQLQLFTLGETAGLQDASDIENPISDGVKTEEATPLISEVTPEASGDQV